MKKFSTMKGFTPIKSGFTLIELLVVIAVLGVLAGGVFVAINPLKRIGQANDAKIKSDIGQIANAMQAYYVTNQRYPTTVGDLVLSGDLKTEPRDPKGNSYAITDPDGIPCTTPCTDIIISAPLDAPQATGGSWQWTSTTGQVGEYMAPTPTPTTDPVPTAIPTPTTDPSLAGYWKMDEGSGTLVRDSSSRGNDASFAGSPSWTPGKFIYGIDNGNTTNDYINAPNVDIASAWTTSAWFKYPLTTTGANWHTLFRGNAGDHQVIVRRSDMQLGMYDNVGGAGFRATGYIITSLSAGWHHLVTVGQSGIQKFYIDGNLVGQTDRQSTTDIRSIGNLFGGNQNWGTVDEVRIYNRALSPSEVSNLYNYTPSP